MSSAKIKVLILSVSGIGNTILQSAMISEILKDQRYDVDILFGNDSMSRVFAYNLAVKEKIVLTHFVGFFGKIRLFKKLYHKHYKFSIAGFPSHRASFNLLPFLTGVTFRCTHRYNWGNILRFSFLSNKKIAAQRRLHDVEQNLNLLQFLGVQKPNKPELEFSISLREHINADNFIMKNNLISDKIVGIHPGSGDLKFKRWGDDRYKALIQILVNKGYQIVLFGVGKELGNFEKSPGVFTFKGDINQTGAMIQKCRFFISGDTGLMHIAAYFSVPQIVIWKGTMLSRTHPINQYAMIFFIESHILYQYPFVQN